MASNRIIDHLFKITLPTTKENTMSLANEEMVNVLGMPIVPGCIIPKSPCGGLVHSEKTVTVTHSELKMAISKAFKVSNITNEEDKELCVAILFETLRNVGVSYGDLFKLLNT